MIQLESPFSREECHDRLRARLDERPFTLRVDPARPLRGRSTIDGFVVRHPRDAVVDAIATYRPGADGGTQIVLRYALTWRSQLGWVVLTVLVLAVAGGFVLARRGPVSADPFAVFAVATAMMAAVILVIFVAMFSLGWVIYGPRQRSSLTRALEETFAVR